MGASPWVGSGPTSLFRTLKGFNRISAGACPALSGPEIIWGKANPVRGFHPRLFTLFPFGEQGHGPRVLPWRCRGGLRRLPKCGAQPRALICPATGTLGTFRIPDDRFKKTAAPTLKPSPAAGAKFLLWDSSGKVRAAPPEERTESRRPEPWSVLLD